MSRPNEIKLVVKSKKYPQNKPRTLVFKTSDKSIVTIAKNVNWFIENEMSFEEWHDNVLYKSYLLSKAK